MSQMPVEAEVVLTADNSAYDQAMMSSAETTAALGNSVDAVTRKISNLTKSAGKGLLGFTAADVALITGATAAYAAYEQQISRLQAQAAIVGRGRLQEQKLLSDYTGSVKTLRKEYGTTTTEAAQLTSQIAKLVDPRQTRKVTDLSKVFTQMSLATGESSTGLSDSLLQLQKTMGTTLTSGTTKKYADQVAYLSQQTSMGAQGLIDFTNQLAPVARLLELNQTQVTGIATGFAKAGQDGFAAANAFNTIVSNIAYAAQSGSPELAKYASLVGMTTEQFKNLEGSEKILRIFDELNRMGPAAITKLNEMGLDGTRTLRAITAVANTQGGLRAAIGQAQAGYGSGAVAEGAEAATKGIVDELQKVRQELQMTAENLGKFSAAFTEKFLRGIDAGASALNKLTSGPFGDFIQILMLGIAPITGFAGGLLLMAGALAKAAAAFTLLRNSGSRGFIEGMRGGARIVPERGPDGRLTGGYVGADGRPLGNSGQRIAQSGSWFQRGLYNAGQPVGNFMGGMMQAGGLAYHEARKLADSNYVPAGGSMWSKGAGASAWAIKNFITPQLDQMRFMDEGKRSRYLSQHGFVAGGLMADQYQVAANASQATQMALGQAQADLKKVEADPAAKAADRIAAQQALATAVGADIKAKAEEKAASNALQRDTRLNNSADGVTRGFKGLALQLANVNRAAIGASIKGGAAATNFAVRNTLGWGRVGGIGALVGGTALASTEFGQQSNALTMGLTGAGVGLMFGGVGAGIGAAAGAGAGLAMDIAKENNNLVDTGNMLKEQIAANAGAFQQNASDLKSYKKKFDEYSDKAEWSTTDFAQFVNPMAGGFFGGIAMNISEVKNSIEGIFGKSNVEEEKERYQEAVDLHETAMADARALAEARGLDISGSAAYVQQQLEEFLAEEGGTILNENGLTFDDYQRARKLVGKEEYIPAKTTSAGQYGATVTTPAKGSMWEAIRYQAFVAETGMTPEEVEELVKGPLNSEKAMARLKASGTSGSWMGSNLVRAAVESPEDAGIFIKAVRQQMTALSGTGLTGRAALRDVEAGKAVMEDISSVPYQIADAVSQQLIQSITMGSQFQGRTQRLRTQQGLYTDLMAIEDPTQQQIGMQDEQRNALIGSFMDQGAYFQQLLYQQREFEVQQERAYIDFGVTRERMDEEYSISRSRAQTDFHLQRVYQEQDYQLGRQRAEQDYEVSRERAQEGFHRSMRRNQQDFNITRRRQEEDYQHQVRLMVEQSAQQMYNIYDRIEVERTASGGYLLYNAQDQLEQMQGQADALDKLRKMGLSDDAIQQLGLTSAENAQQAIRLAAEMADDPQLAEKLNAAIRRRLRAARRLVTDESSKDWEEFTRQYELSVERATEDFERAVRRARRDFTIQMNQMEEDFQKMMNRGAEDYETAQNRQQRAFSLSMERAAEDYDRSVDNMTEDFHKSMRRAQRDLERSSEEISGTMTQILNRAVRSLTGNAQVQARETRKAFRELKRELGTEGNATMALMAQIFGFDFKPIKIGGRGGDGGGPPANDHGVGGPGDRPPLAAGGVLPGFSPGVDNLHFTGDDGSRLHLSGGEGIMVPEWVQAMGGPGVINEMNRRARAHRSYFLGGTMPTQASQVTRHSKREYPNDIWAGDLNDPGSGDLGDPVVAWKRGVVAQVKDIGDQSYGRYIVINHGGSQSSLYAHLSGTAVAPGDTVRAGERIGAVGAYGKATGPHLHFEVTGGTVNIGDTGGLSRGGGMSLRDILKTSYSDIENAADEVNISDGGGRLFRNQRASKLFNRHVKDAWKRLVKRYGAPIGQHGMDGIPSAPANVTGNMAIGKAIAEKMGWTGANWDALVALWNAESGWNHQADNPTSSAYGIPQALVGLHKNNLPAGYYGRVTSGSWSDPATLNFSGGDPEAQIRWGLNYIKNSYGNPSDAWAFHQNNNWYDKGAIFGNSNIIGVGENGPEMVLPLNDRGAGFIADIMSKLHVGNESKMSNLPGGQPMVSRTFNTYQIDRSTNFTGPITVQANNPGELVRQLQARQRVMALSQSSLGGKRI